jgi:imidazolonepropionase-like amidohydrolase
MTRKALLKSALFGALLGPPLPSVASHYAFVDVNVVPMDTERMLHRQTVVVRDGVIEAIGAVDNIDIPPNAEEIRGEGRAWLAPGLADMHTHMGIGDLFDLTLLLSSGVTTILEMGGEGASPLLVSELIESGEIVGPQVYFSYYVDGSHGTVVSDPEAAEAAVTLARRNGYDFIKVYNHLSEPAFSRLVEAATEQGLGVIGHGVRAVGLPEGLERGQIMVAHAEEFFYTTFEHRTDYDAIQAAAQRIAATGAYVTPNLSGFETIVRQWGEPEVGEGFLLDPTASLLSHRIRLRWTQPRYTQRDTPTQARMREILDFLRAFTNALGSAGVPLLTGTDTPAIPGVYPGSSVHWELRNLVEGGLRNFDALSAATRTPGEFLRSVRPEVEQFGVVAVGARADLLLIEANPLENLDTLTRPLGTMAHGRWFPRAVLDGLLQEHADEYRMQLRRISGGGEPIAPGPSSMPTPASPNERPRRARVEARAEGAF